MRRKRIFLKRKSHSGKWALGVLALLAILGLATIESGRADTGARDHRSVACAWCSPGPDQGTN